MQLQAYYDWLLAFFSPTVVAHLALTSAQFTFSGWHVLGSVAFSDGANPYVFILYRCILATLGMYTYTRICGCSITIDPADYGRFLLLGFFFFCNVFFCVLALDFISPPRLAIFQPSVPCIASVISVVLGYDRATVMRTVGIATAAIGAVIAESGKRQSREASTNERNVHLGTIFLVIQVTGLACHQVFAKPLLSKYPPYVVTFIYSSVCLGYLMPVTLGLALMGGITAGDWTFGNIFIPWVAMVYTALLPTLYAYVAISWALKVLTPSVTTVYISIQPVGTTLLSLLVLGSMLSYQELVGGVVVIVGLVLTIMGKPSEKDSVGRGAEEYDQVACSESDAISEVEMKELQHTIESAVGTLPSAGVEADVA